MDIQENLTNALEAMRNEKLKDSPQLTLGELIAKLEAIEDKAKVVVLDFNAEKPLDIDSWRGSYSELSITYNASKDGGQESTVKDVRGFIDMLKSAIGKTFTGYKGGDFKMGRRTPIWVSNYGDADCIGVIDITDGSVVTIVTKELEY